jgi:hypothetical protein
MLIFNSKTIISNTLLDGEDVVSRPFLTLFFLHAIAFAPYMMLLPINYFEICPAVHAPRKCALPSTHPCLRSDAMRGVHAMIQRCFSVCM